MRHRPDAARRAAVALFVVCAVSLVAAWGVTAGRAPDPRPARINVTWNANVDADARAQLEQQFRLTDVTPKEGTTFTYYVTDVSESNLRRIVEHPSVVDTHEIDRAAFRISPTADRLITPDAAPGPLDGLVSTLPTVLAGTAATTLALGLCLFFAPGGTTRGFRGVASIARDTPWVCRRWITSRVPSATAEAVGLFRIVLGLAVVLLLTVHDPVKPDTPGTMAQAITPWLVASGTLFAAGVFSRASYVALLLGVAAWDYTVQPSSHPYAALLMTLICLLPSRWGDAWSVDAWRRERTSRSSVQTSSAQYGYTVWMPSLVMGVLFMAAAIAKLRGAGLAWITNGTVKYHFLTDAALAPVDWGSRLARHDSLAVALSLGAVVTEALVLPAVLSSRYWVRATAGLAAAALLVGFYLFQGVFWPGWWLLLLGFLPWEHVQHTPPPARPAADTMGLPLIQMMLIVAVIAQQILVSMWTLELKPLLSTYDMYSTTYTSHDDYEVSSSASFRMIAVVDGRERTCPITGNESREVVSALRENRAPGSPFERCFPDASGVSSLAVAVTRADVDWEEWRIRGVKQVILAGPSRPGPTP